MKARVAISGPELGDGFGTKGVYRWDRVNCLITLWTVSGGDPTLKRDSPLHSHAVLSSCFFVCRCCICIFFSGISNVGWGCVCHHHGH